MRVKNRLLKPARSFFLCRFEKTDRLKFLPALWLCVLLTSSVRAQKTPDTAAINIAKVDDTLSFISRAGLFIDSSRQRSVEEIIKERFMPLSYFRFRHDIPPEGIAYTYYLRTSLYNGADTAVKVYLFPGAMYREISLFQVNDMTEPGKRVSPMNGYSRYYGFKEIRLTAGQHIEILVKLRFVKNNIAYLSPHFINAAFINDFIIQRIYARMDSKVFGYVISGVLLMMILFMCTNYAISGRKEFLFNALYSASMFLLVFLDSYILRTYSQLTNFFLSYLDFFLLFTGTLFYISFARAFLHTRIRYPQLDVTLQYGQWLILILLTIYTVLNFMTPGYYYQYLLENIMKFLALCLGLLFIGMAIRKQDKLFNYIAAGNAALILFSFVSLAIIWSHIKTSGFLSSSMTYYDMGITIELIFFLLGLTYKNRRELTERIKERELMKAESRKKELENQIAIMKNEQDIRNRTAIRLYSELARNKFLDNPIPEIDKISSFSDELLNNMNAIIWSMGSSNDSLGNTIAYIRSYALEYFENTGIDCQFSLPPGLPNLEMNGEMRRNLFLVVKEALHNILKHAKATLVEIRLFKENEGLTLTIHDNGIGIDLENLRNSGNGLKNMKKRMDDMKIRFTIENKNGTLITLYRRITGY
jgi:signal transduction histidine kinase